MEDWYKIEFQQELHRTSEIICTSILKYIITTNQIRHNKLDLKFLFLIIAILQVILQLLEKPSTRYIITENNLRLIGKTLNVTVLNYS